MEQWIENQFGKITITRDELQTILKDAYYKGWGDYDDQESIQKNWDEYIHSEMIK